MIRSRRCAAIFREHVDHDEYIAIACCVRLESILAAQDINCDQVATITRWDVTKWGLLVRKFLKRIAAGTAINKELDVPLLEGPIILG